MTETTDFTDSTPEELAAELAEATDAAEQAAEAADRERVAALAYADQAADAKRRSATLDAADAASAADNAASRARRAATAAVVASERAWHVQRALDPEHGNDQAAAEGDDEPSPRARALAARDEAEHAAREACSGIDWLRFHLDGHCQTWRERLSDGATSTAA